MSHEVKTGNCMTVLPTIEAGSVQTCVTSPPYFGLRDYGTAKWEGGSADCDHRPDTQTQFAAASTLVGGTKHQENCGARRGYERACPKCGARRVDSQVGLEETPELYVERLVGIFREVRRVLHDDGTLWLNLGDSYATSGGASVPQSGDEFKNRRRGQEVVCRSKRMSRGTGRWGGGNNPATAGLKPKDLIGIPWMVAFALRADGWYLRSDVIWHKPNPMPESVTDRPTKAHEYLFLLSKSASYFYDAAAIAEPTVYPVGSREDAPQGSFNGKRAESGLHDSFRAIRDTRNRRSVWTVATKPFPEAHFATFPEQLIEPCILAGSREGDTVLDPFNGAGTTGVVAIKHGRNYLGIELNPEYVEMSGRRLAVAEAMALRAKGIPADIPRPLRNPIDTPLFNTEVA